MSVGVNPLAGEVALIIDGQRHVLKLTLGALAQLETALGADSLMLGYCLPTANIHSPNEFMHVRDFEAGIRSTTALIGMMAEA